MGTAREIREFLATRRAKITPQQASLPAFASGTRARGLWLERDHSSVGRRHT
ncbi:hypothetical protein ACWDCX_03980 [Streptomyces fungicidicus]|jgi:hypothetical protein